MKTKDKMLFWLGGRYDKLISLISPRDIPGVGWAAGIERLMSLVNIYKTQR